MINIRKIFRDHLSESTKQQVHYAIRKIVATFYNVDSSLNPSWANCFCPCCEKRFRRFIDDGKQNGKHDYYNPIHYAKTEQKVVCPVCNAIPRHRILALYFKKHINDFKGKKILYFAQEQGIKLFLDRHEINVTTADLFAPVDLKLDIQDTKLPDNS